MPLTGEMQLDVADAGMGNGQLDSTKSTCDSALQRSLPPENSGQSGSLDQDDPNNASRDTSERVDSQVADSDGDGGESAQIENNEKSDDDVASKAAMTLAAVAAAATANNTSPSAAAEAARALAPDLVPKSASSVLPLQSGMGETSELQTVRLAAVKEHLKQGLEEDGKAMWNNNGRQRMCTVRERLAIGENDTFLRHLLLLQHFLCKSESSSDASEEPEETQSLNGNEQSSDSRDSVERDRARVSAGKVRSVLTMAEDSYDAMTALLPPTPTSLPDRCRDVESTSTFAQIVPDLLPPCISLRGDPTSHFFQACSGTLKSTSQEHNDFLQAPEFSAGKAQDGDVNTTVASEADESVQLKSASSVLTSMFTSMTRVTKTTQQIRQTSIAGVFRKKTRGEEDGRSDVDDVDTVDSPEEAVSNGEYIVNIDREMLGLTVENVLERTVVRTVLPGGAAKRAGARVGALIVKVGNVETKNLTHFETIDELRQSQRPLRLVLRQISTDALRAAREEMGRLIRGGAFGTQGRIEDEKPEVQNNMPRKGYTGRSLRTEPFSQVLHKRWTTDASFKSNERDIGLTRVEERLVWILTLLVIGLEREASTSSDDNKNRPDRNGSSGSHTCEYGDAARSVAKVLFDFTGYRLASPQMEPDNSQADVQQPGLLLGAMARRARRGPPPPGRSIGNAQKLAAHQHISVQRSIQDSGSFNDTLLRIGEVLQRSRSFLADPLSPPAALLRGEVIAVLGDILCLDTEMKLSEDDPGSSANRSAGALSDLGSAGSLLKLIILNCSMMRSPECVSMGNAEMAFGKSELEAPSGDEAKADHLDFHGRHAGNRFLAVVHRLAASRSISARITACSLGPVLWGHLDRPHQLQLRGVITRALHDVDVLVRKSTAAVLHEIAELVFDSRAVPWLILMCERAMTDPEPQLRAAAMTLTWHLAEHLPNAFLGDARKGSRSVRRLPPRTDPTFAEVYLLQCKLLPVATRLAEDRAAAVRLAVAAQCDRLCSALGDHWYSVIIDVLQALLGDADERVRGEAILCVPRLTEIVLVCSPNRASPSGGVGVLEALFPVSIKLVDDPSANVRVALATAAGELLTLLVGLESLEEISPPVHEQFAAGQEESAPQREYKKHVDETLIPLLQKLLDDNEPEVTSSALRAVTNASRGNVREIQARKNSTSVEDDTLSLSSFQSHTSIEKKDPVFLPVLSETQVLRLLPTLSGLAESKQWRVRQGAVEIVPALLGCTNKLEIRSEIAQLCFRLMGDHVDAVRNTAAECLCLGGGSLGSHGEAVASEWVSAIVIPHVRSCSQSSDYKQRRLALKMVEVILGNNVCPSIRRKPSQEPIVTAHRELVELGLALRNDSVANVRLNVGRVFAAVMSTLQDEEVALVSKELAEQLQTERSRTDGGDRDVLYYASKALARAHSRGEDASLMSSDSNK